MPEIVTTLSVFIFLIVIANAIVLIIRISKNRSPYGRRGKIAPTEIKAAIKRERDIYRRIHVEQERIRRYLDLRQKTWDLYEEVRQKYKTTENTSKE